MTAVRVPLRAGREVSGEATLPANDPPSACVVLGHGAGSDLGHPFLASVASDLAASGCYVLRFNFPYADARRKVPDQKVVLDRTFEDAAAFALEQAGGRPPVVLGGKSMGGRSASRLAAARYPSHGLLLLGYPLHPPGRPEELRTEHFSGIRIPTLFIQGTRDTLCRLDLLRPAIADIPGRVRLHIIDGGDHSFHLPAKAGRSDADVYREIGEVAGAWIRDEVNAAPG